MSLRQNKLIRFFVASGLGALINVVSRALLGLVMAFEIAVVLAYLFAMTVTFLMNRAYVFPEGRLAARTQYLRFALVNGVSLLIVWGVSVGLLRVVFPAIGMDWHPALVAHSIGVASPAFVAYYLHKAFTFA
ncbi:GtrA family protein [Litorisediminicola beolgyonensis]|uniref:GtrA family protein n=1 Tax=Litorisediminicola beolgyonensis TaxID=1173614 RepID=A0ABW3ZDQ9_9RHOB